MNRRQQSSIIDFQAYIDRMEERLAADRKETAERLAADRKDTAERLAADRKDSEARIQASYDRLAQERKESEARLIQERKEAQQTLNTQKNWLIATFFTVLFGKGAIIVTIVLAILAING